jgi:hypothetical protein
MCKCTVAQNTGLQTNELKSNHVRINLTCLEEGVALDSKSSKNNPTDFSESERLRMKTGGLAKEGIDPGRGCILNARCFADLE